MYSQAQANCPDCSGKGETMKEEDRCKNCKGEKVLEVEKMLEVAVEAGCPNEHDYIFTGENNEYVLFYLLSQESSPETSTPESRSRDMRSTREEEPTSSTSRRFPFWRHLLELLLNSLTSMARRIPSPLLQERSFITRNSSPSEV